MRLTIRNSDGTVSQPMNLNWSAALEKLAAYEDTGLEPDDIRENIGLLSPICVGCDGKTADGKRTKKCTYVDDDFRKCIERSVHLSELAQAEEHGLLVRLPCKVGDTIYAPTRNIISEFRVSQFDYGGYEESYLWVEWYLTKGITGNYRMDGIRASEIGKTVFLTREEAEAALKGEGGYV